MKMFLIVGMLSISFGDMSVLIREQFNVESWNLAQKCILLIQRRLHQIVSKKEVQHPLTNYIFPNFINYSKCNFYSHTIFFIYPSKEILINMAPVRWMGIAITFILSFTILNFKWTRIHLFYAKGLFNEKNK